MQRPPFARRTIQQLVLDWPLPRRQRGAIRIDPFGVRQQQLSAGRVLTDVAPLPFGRAWHAEPAGFLIGRQRHLANQLRERTFAGAGLNLELEQPVARRDVAKRAHGVGIGGRKNMGNAA